MLTMLDIIKQNGADPVTGLIDETVLAHPEITAIAARTIKGEKYKTMVRTALPVTGFRSANQGMDLNSSKYEEREVETFIYNAPIQADKAVADKSEDGATAFIAREAKGVLESCFQTLARCFYYGRNATYGGDAKAYAGLLDFYDPVNYVVDAGGTSANTGTSVWAIKTDPEHVQWVMGVDGQFQLSDLMLQRVVDGNNKPYMAYYQELLSYPGVQHGSVRGVSRIKKITNDAGHTLNDNLLAQLIALHPLSDQPTFILMNRRARAQLQQSRTVTLFGNSSNQVSGAIANVAPVPTEYNGIPILTTDAISNVESLTL